jgi:hypothetical protein
LLCPPLPQAMAAGWLVDFSSAPALHMSAATVRVPPERLALGLANGWAGTRAAGGKSLLVWPDECEAAWETMGPARRPRGFMFWDIADEGGTPHGATGTRDKPLFMARELGAFMHTRGPPPRPA